MKAPQVLTVFSFLICLHSTTILSQIPESSPGLTDTLQYRKLYLHTDRDHYFLGDTLWYKAYYLDGQSHRFIPGLISMYVDLIDQAGQPVFEQVVAIDNGAADGAIDLPSTLEQGEYMLRAYTDFQRGLGEDAFFHKQLKISKLESFVEGAEQPTTSELPDIDVAFLPEGGMLLEGQMNTVGVKAIDTRGNGVPIQGEILNSKGESMAAFTTSYKGMTSIRFVPRKDENYTARLSAHPGYKYTFTVVKEGIKIEFEREEAGDLIFRAVTNAEVMLGQTYCFAISHRGEVIFHHKFVPNSTIYPITVNKDALPSGINRMVLLNEQLLPVSERLYFSKNYQINEIEIEPDKQAYETRSRVRLNLLDGVDMDIGSWSNLSMTVVDALAGNNDGPVTNILSWLLIDSELRGHIESPLEYFKDDEEMVSASKLDLLMITQGWSTYIWSNPEEYLASESKEEEGFALSGTARKTLSNKPATEGTVELKIYNNDFIHMDEVETDEKGRFVFKDVSFMDTASVFVQARNRLNRLAYKVELDPIFDAFPFVSAKHLPKEGSSYSRQAELYQKQYDNLQALKEYTLKTGGVYLEEVTITEHKREQDDGHFRIYAKPSTSIELTNRDLAYVNVFDYIRGRFAGVMVTGDHNVIIRGISSFGGGDVSAASNSAALLLLDGFPIKKEAMETIPMNDIEKIEVLKNPSETAIFGVRGANGVVSVFTKRGGVPDYSDKYLPGTIADRLVGYSSSRECYSPKYTPESFNDERPDHRIVLYWNPNIFTEDWEASVSFFTSDDITRYKVFVEGITNDGKVCLGTTSFQVN